MFTEKNYKMSFALPSIYKENFYGCKVLHGEYKRCCRKMVFKNFAQNSVGGIAGSEVKIIKVPRLTTSQFEEPLTGFWGIYLVGAALRCFAGYQPFRRIIK